MSDRSAGTLDLLGQLRAATRDLHDSLEARAFGQAIRARSLSPTDYAQMLCWQWRSHQWLETAMGVPLCHWQHYTYVSRLPALQNDLERLFSEAAAYTLTDAEMPARFARPTLPTCVGYCYVLEGAGLGGSLIYRALAESPQLSDFEPFAFYEFQRRSGLESWRQFVALAQETGAEWTPAATTMAVTAAREAFLVFADQLERVIAVPRARR